VRYSERTLKKLFGLSGNQCAFPGCIQPVIDSQTGLPIGQICHIKGKSPNGPRYDPNQSEQDRNDYPNLLVMCPVHNKTVDDAETCDQFPVPLLAEFKKNHESRSHNTLVSEDLLAKVVKLFELVENLQPPPKPLTKLTPLIESHRTGTDHTDIDDYAFRVTLRNDGEKTVKSYRIEVEIPNAYADPTHQSSMRGRIEVRDDVTVYTDTEEGHPGFTLYPKRTSDLLMNTNYIMHFNQYENASGTIMVNVYFDDELVGHEEFSIANHRNKDRMDYLGLSE
jgi:hypothetical protein